MSYYDEYFKEVDQQEFEESLSNKKQQEFRAYIKAMSLVESDDITLTLLQYRPVRAPYKAGRLIKFEKMPEYTETKICLAMIELPGSYKQYEYMIPQFIDQLYMSNGAFKIDTKLLKIEQVKPIDLVNAGQDEVGFFGYDSYDNKSHDFNVLVDDKYKYRYDDSMRALDLTGIAVKDIGYDFQKLGKCWRVYMPQGLVDAALTNNKKINLGNCQIRSKNERGIVLETIDMDKIVNGQSLFIYFYSK